MCNKISLYRVVAGVITKKKDTTFFHRIIEHATSARENGRLHRIARYFSVKIIEFNIGVGSGGLLPRVLVLWHIVTMDVVQHRGSAKF